MTWIDPVTHVEGPPGQTVTSDARNSGAELDSVPGAPSVNYQYVSWDHLGSTRLVTDEEGNALTVRKHYPFGQDAIIPVGADVRQRFTGHERDAAIGLDYMRNRYYSPALAIMLGSDKGPATPADPQSWNRYAYVRNNPGTSTDPSGDLPVYLTPTINFGWTLLAFGGMGGSLAGTPGERLRGGNAQADQAQRTSAATAQQTGAEVLPTVVFVDTNATFDNPRYATPLSGLNALAAFLADCGVSLLVTEMNLVTNLESTGRDIEGMTSGGEDLQSYIASHPEQLTMVLTDAFNVNGKVGQAGPGFVFIGKHASAGTYVHEVKHALLSGGKPSGVFGIIRNVWEDLRLDMGKHCDAIRDAVSRMPKHQEAPNP